MFKILTVVEKTIEKGDNIGNPYFVASCKEANPFITKIVKVAIFPEKDDEVTIKEWRDYIASGKYPAVMLKRFVIGDTSVNPNATPLPPFRLKKNDGTLGADIYTSIVVTLLVDNEGVPYKSPINTAKRIISQQGEWVGVSEPEEVSAHVDPLAT